MEIGDDLYFLLYCKDVYTIVAQYSKSTGSLVDFVKTGTASTNDTSLYADTVVLYNKYVVTISNNVSGDNITISLFNPTSKSFTVVSSINIPWLQGVQYRFDTNYVTGQMVVLTDTVRAVFGFSDIFKQIVQGGSVSDGYSTTQDAFTDDSWTDMNIVLQTGQTLTAGVNLHHVCVFNTDRDAGDSAIRHDVMLEGNNNYINTTNLVESRVVVKKGVSKL